MNPSQVTFTTTRVLLITCLALAPFAQAEEKKNGLFEAISDVVDKAVEAVKGPQRRPAAPVAAAVVAEQVVPAPPAAEVEQRKKRLNFFSRAMQEWIIAEADLSDDQVKLLKTAALEAVQKSQGAFRRGVVGGQNPRSQQFPDFFPISMTGLNGAAQAIDFTRFRLKMRQVNLTAEQNRKLDKAIKEREQFHKDAALGRILNLLDAELFLSSAQRKSLEPTIKSRVSLSEQCYSLTPMNYYFQQTSIAGTVNKGPGLKELNNAQKARADDISHTGRGGSSQHLMFETGEGVDEWQTKLSNSVREQKAKLNRACAVRVAFYRSEHNLSDSEARHLEVAGKGTVDEVATAWKESTREQLERNQLQWGGRNVRFGLQAANVKQIEEKELWQNTLLPLIQGKTDAMDSRNTRRKSAMAMFVVSLLDRELWLSTDQRQQLLKVVRQQMPDPDYTNNYRMYWEELILFAIPVHKSSKQDTRMLSETQKSIIALLKKIMPYDGQYIRMVIKNGGQMAFDLPR